MDTRLESKNTTSSTQELIKEICDLTGLPSHKSSLNTLFKLNSEKKVFLSNLMNALTELTLNDKVKHTIYRLLQHPDLVLNSQVNHSFFTQAFINGNVEMIQHFQAHGIQINHRISSLTPCLTQLAIARKESDLAAQQKAFKQLLSAPNPMRFDIDEPTPLAVIFSLSKDIQQALLPIIYQAIKTDGLSRIKDAEITDAKSLNDFIASMTGRSSAGDEKSDHGTQSEMTQAQAADIHEHLYKPLELWINQNLCGSDNPAPDPDIQKTIKAQTKNESSYSEALAEYVMTSDDTYLLVSVLNLKDNFIKEGSYLFLIKSAIRHGKLGMIFHILSTVSYAKPSQVLEYAFDEKNYQNPQHFFGVINTLLSNNLMLTAVSIPDLIKTYLTHKEKNADLAAVLLRKIRIKIYEIIKNKRHAFSSSLTDPTAWKKECHAWFKEMGVMGADKETDDMLLKWGYQAALSYSGTLGTTLEVYPIEDIQAVFHYQTDNAPLQFTDQRGLDCLTNASQAALHLRSQDATTYHNNCLPQDLLNNIQLSNDSVDTLVFTDQALCALNIANDPLLNRLHKDNVESTLKRVLSSAKNTDVAVNYYLSKRHTLESEHKDVIAAGITALNHLVHRSKEALKCAILFRCVLAHNSEDNNVEIQILEKARELWENDREKNGLDLSLLKDRYFVYLNLTNNYIFEDNIEKAEVETNNCLTHCTNFSDLAQQSPKISSDILLGIYTFKLQIQLFGQIISLQRSTRFAEVEKILVEAKKILSQLLDQDINNASVAISTFFQAMERRVLKFAPKLANKDLQPLLNYFNSFLSQLIASIRSQYSDFTVAQFEFAIKFCLEIKILLIKNATGIKTSVEVAAAYQDFFHRISLERCASSHVLATTLSAAAVAATEIDHNDTAIEYFKVFVKQETDYRYLHMDSLMYLLYKKAEKCTDDKEKLVLLDQALIYFFKIPNDFAQRKGAINERHSMAANIWLLKGCVFVRQNRWEEAKKCIKQAVDLLNKNTDPASLLLKKKCEKILKIFDEPTLPVKSTVSTSFPVDTKAAASTTTAPRAKPKKTKKIPAAISSTAVVVNDMELEQLKKQWSDVKVRTNIYLTNIPYHPDYQKRRTEFDAILDREEESLTKEQLTILCSDCKSAHERWMEEDSRKANPLRDKTRKDRAREQKANAQQSRAKWKYKVEPAATPAAISTSPKPNVSASVDAKASQPSSLFLEDDVQPGMRGGAELLKLMKNVTPFRRSHTSFFRSVPDAAPVVSDHKKSRKIKKASVEEDEFQPGAAGLDRGDAKASIPPSVALKKYNSA